MGFGVFRRRPYYPAKGRPVGPSVLFQVMNISATLAGTSTATGTLTGVGDMSANLAGTSTVTATLTGNGDMSAVLAGTSTTTGTLTGTGALSAALAGTSTASGTLTGAGALEAALAGTSTAAGTLSATGALAATLAGTSTAAGTMTGTGALVATLSGTSAVVVAASATGQMAALINGSSTFGETPATPHKGAGSEPFGDPFGFGGMLHVVRARAIASHVVRVTFDAEPLHKSPAGRHDALNPANYLFAAFSGQVMDPATGAATSPQAIGVATKVVSLPAPGLAAAPERGVDVHVDRALVVGVRYQVTVSHVKSKLGDDLGTENNPIVFPGIFRVAGVRPQRQPRGLVDIANGIFNGAWIVDDSGDLATEEGLEALRKRVYRRLTTPKGAFAFLQDYGVGLRLKELASLGMLQSLKTDLTQQLRREPEVQDVEVSLSLRPEGLLTVALKLSLRTGAIVELQATRASDGSVVL